MPTFQRHRLGGQAIGSVPFFQSSSSGRSCKPTPASNHGCVDPPIQVDFQEIENTTIYHGEQKRHDKGVYTQVFTRYYKQFFQGAYNWLWWVWNSLQGSTSTNKRLLTQGVLENGEEIAIKKLHCMPGLDDTQFRNEFNNLMRVQHQNITRLVGYCYHLGHERIMYNGEYIFALVEERVLCFEYLQGGSLDKYITDESCGLDWRTRYKIIKGVCDGLNCLHNGYKDPIYHMDLKPANILLDKDMTPKIGDFGLSRLFPSAHTYTTIKIIGTPGYMPPEYIEKYEITSKFDVFSLGVIIIRIIAGDEGYSKRANMSSQEFVEHVHENWRKRLRETMPSHTSQEVMACIEIALRCMEADRVRRPTISEIVIELNKIGAEDMEDRAFEHSDDELIGDQHTSGDLFVAPSSMVAGGRNGIAVLNKDKPPAVPVEETSLHQMVKKTWTEAGTPSSSLSYSNMLPRSRASPDGPEYDFLLKIVLTGNSGVGKSNILSRFTHGSFSTSYITTIGRVEFEIRTVELDGRRIKLQIWDTAGQESYRALTAAYYRAAMGILLVYDVTNESSFNSIIKWNKEIEEYATDANKILVGNRIDMAESRRAVPTSRGQALADEYGIKFFETSAKTNLNVELAFFSLVREVMDRLPPPETDSIPVDPTVQVETSQRRHRNPLAYARELFSKKK